MVTLDSSLAALKLALTQSAATSSVNQNSNRVISTQSSLSASTVTTEAVRLSQSATNSLNNQRYLAAAYKAQAMLQVADKAATNMTTKLQDLRKLAISATSTTLDDSARALLSAEFEGKRASLLTMTQNSRWNGMRLFDGSAGTKRDGTVSFQVGPGSSGQLDVALPNLRQDVILVSGVRNVQGSYASGLSEVQTIDMSSANLANKTVTVSFGDVSLSSGLLSSNAATSDLVTGLTSDTNYSSAPFTISDNGANKVLFSWKTSGVISSTVQLQVTANAQVSTFSRRTTGVSEADLPAQAEQQFIAVNDANLSTATSIVITDGSASQNSYGVSFASGSLTVSGLVDVFNTDYSATMPFTLAAEPNGIRINWNATGAQSGLASLVVSSLDNNTNANSTAVFDATQTVVGAVAGKKEVQNIVLSDAAIRGQTITLTANGTTLSSGQMANAATLSDLLAALQADANYGAAGVDLSLDTTIGSTVGLKLTWQTASTVSDQATVSLLDTSNESTISATRTQTGSTLNSLDGTAEIQRIAISASKITGKNVQIKLGDFAMFSGKLDSEATVQKMVDAITANSNYSLAPFTVSQSVSGYVDVTWKTFGPVSELATLNIQPDNPFRSLIKTSGISTSEAASSTKTALDIALQTLTETKTSIGIAGVQLTAAVEKLASSNVTSQRNLTGSSASSYMKTIASLLRSQMSENSLQAAWAQASLTPGQVANTLA